MSTDVQRTLAYRSDVFTKKLLWLPVLALALSLFFLIYGSASDRMSWQPWLGLVCSIGWLGYAFFRLAVPDKPMLVLSPRGMTYRNLSENLIPWQEIENVDATDHTFEYRSSPVTFENVTVIWVSRDFYEHRIYIDSFIARGPFWDNNIIDKGPTVGIVVVHGLLSVEPEPLRTEIVTRWKAFRDQPRVQIPRSEKAAKAVSRRWGHVEQWVLNVAFALGLVAIHFGGNLFESKPATQDWAAREKEWAALDQKVKQIEETMKRDREQADEKWRQTMPWMSDDARRAQIASQKQAAPPQVRGPAVGHRDSVSVLAVAPDGRRFVSGGVDRIVKLWNADEAKVLRDIGAHKDVVRAVHLLPDGARVLSAGDDGEIALRNLDDGKVLHVFEAPEHGRVLALAVSGDGRRALSSHRNGTGLVWDLETRTLVTTLNSAGQRTVALSHDGTQAISGGDDGALWLWDVAAGSMLRTLDGGHKGGVYSVAFLPGGRQAVSGGADDALRLFDLQSGAQLRTFAGHTGTVYAVAVSGDGKRIVSGSSDATARLWTLDTGKEHASFKTSSRVRAIALLADGDIVTGGADGIIRVWKPNGQLMRVFAASN